MKKKYNAPYLLVESFQLDNDVASCSGEGAYVLNYDSAKCYTASGITASLWFSDGVCENDAIYPSGKDGNDKPCYHGVFAPGTFFAS